MSFYTDQLTKLTEQLYANADQTARVVRARRFIDTHFAEPLTLVDIAAAACCSPYHFSREFKRHYGLTPLHYLTDKRMAEARRLLNANRPVAEVCGAVGYESLGTFSTLVKKRMGQSPGTLKRARMKK
ncbi:transcriptional regulator, AraC family [Fibrella aestuarina BUZ 2]|uniref:Transcriptional regulator, AraC family n=1 Tax=Fibrella aestuarina BUZ 2 TaxID=1166018 RepID=I0KEV4_9BACT|nr:AraC family transcriptional regulator [Fibrella aestuarina]CCH02657.1 transcriptional regulator, AraC family [Fibrella aestuarina BUZ 2]